jgi:hypothetical protein
MALAYLRCMLKNVKIVPTVKHFIIFDKSNMLRGTVLNNTITYFQKPGCETSLTKIIKQILPNYKYRLEMTRFIRLLPTIQLYSCHYPPFPPQKKNFVRKTIQILLGIWILNDGLLLSMYLIIGCFWTQICNFKNQNNVLILRLDVKDLNTRYRYIFPTDRPFFNSVASSVVKTL